METQYYTVKDVMRITGSKRTYSYDLIKKLKERFEVEYPGTIVKAGTIPKWFFDEVMVFKRPQKSEPKIESQDSHSQ